MRQLQGMDSSFLALETRNTPMHIGSILIYDPSTAPGGFVRFKDILRFYESRMQLSKVMRQKLVRVPFDLDFPYWIEDEDFDLEFHLRHLALPQPGDWRQLCIQAARIFARPLDLSRPPWEFTVVEGLDNVEGVPQGSYAIVTKVHHCAIDGMSGIDLIDATHTLDPNAPPPNEPDEWKPDKHPDKLELLFRSYVNAVTNPVRQARVMAQAVPGVYKAARGVIAKEMSLENTISSPRSRFNVPVSPHRVTDCLVMPLAELKAMRALAPDCKINDVFLAIIGGAMRKYLAAKDDLPDKSLTAMAPISVRATEEKNTMGNQVSAMIAPLGTHIEDPVERLGWVFEQTRNSKAMTDALGARQMTEISKASPLLFMALGAQLYSRLGLANYMKPLVATVVTNVPGPPVPIYSTGAKMVHMSGLLCLADGVALGHVVQSYVDQATIQFIACRKVMPDPEFYTECLRESYDEMKAAFEAASQKAKEKPAKAPAKARKSSGSKRKTASADS